MSGAIVNLRLARKAKARVEAVEQAAANRARFGRTKAERDAASREAEHLTRIVEGAKRDPGRKGAPES